ncbi:sporulation YhaL family protein [Siminovitchia sp. 179-K 8D1 HS]|uniref:sporulation YhaL family protein n=1 Tax=Siminovitchia sp. 179-K 8D1 HS TaxID=3142385 RepID=UPI00399F37A5
MSLPIWLYVVIAGIFVSAFMAVKTAREDREVEQEWIEKEGEVFIKRMEEEKERKRGINEAGNA